MNKIALLEHLSQQFQYHNEEVEKYTKGQNFNETYKLHQVASNVYKKLIQEIEAGEFDN